MSESSPVRARAQRRRRQPNVSGARPVRRELTLSIEDDARLVELAAAAGVSVPRLLVEAALAEHGETATDRSALRTEFFHARRLMSAVSNNLNQMTRAANATGEVQEDLADTLAVIGQVARRLDAALTALGAGR